MLLRNPDKFDALTTYLYLIQTLSLIHTCPILPELDAPLLNLQYDTTSSPRYKWLRSVNQLAAPIQLTKWFELFCMLLLHFIPWFTSITPLMKPRPIDEIKYVYYKVHWWNVPSKQYPPSHYQYNSSKQCVPGTIHNSSMYIYIIIHAKLPFLGCHNTRT